MHSTRTAKLLASLACMILASGCQDESAKRIELREQIIEAEGRIEKLKEENNALQATIDQQEELILQLRDLGDKRLENLFTVEKIELGRFTGPANLDDEPGQDGVRVRFTPIDRVGTPIKRAGTVEIRLFDLADQEAPLRIGGCTVDVEKIGEYWSGHFGTFHFSIPCRWDRPPSEKDMTIRVAFTEYLTGRVFTAQTNVQVETPQKDGVEPEPAGEDAAD